MELWKRSGNAQNAGGGSEGQRIYIVFARGRPLRFLAHLDMMRLWVRAIRRAGLPLRYSQGHHPHPRLALASPLPVGVTAAAEWLEIELQSPVGLDEIRGRLTEQLPEGLQITGVSEAPWGASSLASRLWAGEYEVEVRPPPPRTAVQEHIRRFLASTSWPMEEERRGRRRTVDLRSLVLEAEVGDWDDERGRLRLLLRHGAAGSVRPESVLRAWGLETPVWVHRKRLIFGGSSPLT